MKTVLGKLTDKNGVTHEKLFALISELTDPAADITTINGLSLQEHKVEIKSKELTQEMTGKGKFPLYRKSKSKVRRKTPQQGEQGVIKHWSPYEIQQKEKAMNREAGLKEVDKQPTVVKKVMHLMLHGIPISIVSVQEMLPGTHRSTANNAIRKACAIPQIAEHLQKYKHPGGKGAGTGAGRAVTYTYTGPATTVEAVLRKQSALLRTQGITAADTAADTAAVDPVTEVLAASAERARQDYIKYRKKLGNLADINNKLQASLEVVEIMQAQTHKHESTITFLEDEVKLLRTAAVKEAAEDSLLATLADYKKQGIKFEVTLSCNSIR